MLGRALTAAIAALTLTAVPAAAAVPAGPASEAQLAPGVLYQHYTGSIDMHVTRLSATAVDQLRVEPAAGRVSGARETVPAMCARLHCLVAVNGDYFGPRDTSGGMVSAGRLLRSAVAGHEQLLFAPHGTAVPGRSASWRAVLEATDGTRLEPQVNVVNGRGSLDLFTPDYAGVPAAVPGDVEMLLSFSQPATPLGWPGDVRTAHAVGLRHDAAFRSVPHGRLVLVGHGPGAHALQALWTRMRHQKASWFLQLGFDVGPGVTEAVGGHPVLIRNGTITLDPHDPVVRTRHVRTLAAGDGSGGMWLVVTDSKITLFRAAEMLRGWGARWAVNLDGGGSTTMVVRNRVVNRPSDGAPRGVASGLVVLPPPAVRARPAPPQSAPPPPPPPPAEVAARPVRTVPVAPAPRGTGEIRLAAAPTPARGPVPVDPRVPLLVGALMAVAVGCLRLVRR